MKLPQILALLFISVCVAACGLKLSPKPADGEPATYPGQYPKPENDA